MAEGRAEENAEKWVTIGDPLLSLNKQDSYMEHAGAVPGVSVGRTFEDRRKLHDANVHRGLVQGISGKGYSIVLSGGYEDDIDDGEVIVYTGQGGRDMNTGKQVADQKLNRGNLALASNMKNGVPVRVIRGYQLGSKYAPSFGYRYDGLYRIEECWSEKGKKGFLVYRYRLVRLAEVASIGVQENTPATTPPVDELPTGSALPRRTEAIISRVIRSSAIGNSIKELYAFSCQFCGTALETGVGRYAECCHIKPLGKPHDGPDVPENVLCLCPNCHVLFDTYTVTLSDDLRCSSTGKRISLLGGHKLNLDYIRYHRDRAPTGRRIKEPPN